ncbi:lectin alpha chain isoform X1 [Neltuma alba]|uniref:lectin alpha chain isoform X1 n=1 Tax=Neltuma alba TaxID=207710 RepID=UPI0010A54BF6|nr:lectin alpha chain-like isoform X1 [Prosopis alba]
MEASQYRKRTHILPGLVITKVFLLLIIPAAASSIRFDYQQFLETSYEDLTFDGDVYQQDEVLQLTRYRKDSAGRVTYSKLLQLWDKETGKIADFTTRFTFIIDSPDINHRGDGITFFLAHPNFSLPVPPDGSGIGLVGRKQVMDDPNYTLEHPFVAVEFDTLPNDDDPPYDHVGVDINKMWTPYTTEWFSIKDGRKYDAEITYNSSSYQLNVFFTGYKDDMRVQQDYSHGINLREILPDQVQFGFSSATGLLWEIHTLCAWSFDSSLLGEN